MNVNVDFACGPGPEFECLLGAQVNCTCVLSEGLSCIHQEDYPKNSFLHEEGRKTCRNTSVRRIRNLADLGEL